MYAILEAHMCKIKPKIIQTFRPNNAFGISSYKRYPELLEGLNTLFLDPRILF